MQQCDTLGYRHRYDLGTRHARHCLQCFLLVIMTLFFVVFVCVFVYPRIREMFYINMYIQCYRIRRIRNCELSRQQKKKIRNVNVICNYNPIFSFANIFSLLLLSLLCSFVFGGRADATLSPQYGVFLSILRICIYRMA